MEKFKKDALETVMADRFGRYSKYIIQERALPDVRDGLKPVQRRILFAMHKDGNTHDKAYRKSAKTVGLVIGNYHPHGDSSVYDAMVRLSQPWKMRQTLIDMQGNNGSIDDDPAAAMRYTEARLDGFAQHALLADIDEDTVNFSPNFDDTSLEPSVLPAGVPHLLINGASGIAAGYATNIPPHNLSEVISATIHRIHHPASSLDDLMQHMLGPDFPTGGVVQGRQGIRDAFESGRGRMVVRAKAEIHSQKNLHQIILTELPFEVVKSTLVKKMDDIRLNKLLDGMVDVRDESDRTGLRIVVDVKKEADPHLILNYLFKHTECQIYYNYNLVSIIDQRPVLSGLMDVLDAFIAFRKELVVRRSQHRKARIEARLHILEGLIKAISVLDEVIALIRAAKDKADAKLKLIERFAFTEIQAEAIVNLRLYRLTNTDIKELKSEMAELNRDLSHLKGILEHESLLKDVLVKEMMALAASHETPRRTRIEAEVEEIVIDKLSMIANERTVLTLSRDGYIKRVSMRSYQASEGVAPTLKDNDELIGVVEADTYDHVMPIFSNGEYGLIPLYEVSETKWKDNPEHLSHYLKLDQAVHVVRAVLIKSFKTNQTLVTVSRKGMIKKTQLSDTQLSRLNRSYGLMKLDVNDAVVASFLCDDSDDVVVMSQQGYAVRYGVDQVPSTQPKSKGVKAINLGAGDHVADATRLNTKSHVVVITETALMKRIKLQDLNRFNRPAKGELLAKKVKSNPNLMRYIEAYDAYDAIRLTHAEARWLSAKEVAIMDTNATFANPLGRSETLYMVKGIEVSDLNMDPSETSKKVLETPPQLSEEHVEAEDFSAHAFKTTEASTQEALEADQNVEPSSAASADDSYILSSRDFEDPDHQPSDHDEIEFMHFDLDDLT